MKKLIIANWKVNPDSPGRAVVLARKIESKIRPPKNVEVVIAPPLPFLSAVGAVLKKSKLGAQNVFWGDTGPYTGEVSWHQLKHFKIQYVIVGHSERRAYLGETDEIINRKVAALLRNEMSPILCVGETERSGDQIPEVVGQKLRAALKGISKQIISNLAVAYEPAWAISTNSAAAADAPDDAFRAKIYIRKILADLYGRKAAESIRVIYGGSVTAENIASFLSEARMEGALVGGASLRPDEFAEIVRIAAAT